MFDVGRSKRAERAFAFDDITIVPSRRTRGEEEVSLQWRIDAYIFDFPLLAAPMDSVVSPTTAIRISSIIAPPAARSVCCPGAPCGCLLRFPVL